MTSDDDYDPPNESSNEGCRRSKRITRYSFRKAKTLKKPYDQAEPESIRTKNSKKSPKIAKENFKDASDKDFGKFSGEPLLPAELNGLLRKFKEDGHFRCVSSPSSSPRPRARRTDGKLSAKRKKQSAETTAASTSQRASLENNIEEETSPQAFDPLSVTMSNPLPNASGSTLHISPDKSSYIPLFPLEQYKNWNIPMVHQNFLSSGTFREKKGMDLSSNRNSAPSFVPSKQLQPPSMPNSYKHVFNKPNLNSAWKSFDHGGESPTDPRNQALPCGLYYHGNNAHMGYNESSTSIQTKRLNHENSYENCPKPPCTQIYQNNNRNGFSQTENATGTFQGRQMSSVESSANASQTEIPYGNYPCNWVGTAVNNVSSTFKNSNSQIPSHLTDPQNPPNYFPPDLSGYNSELRSIDNLISSSGFGENENSIIGHNSNPSAHYMSLMPWNGLQVFPNLCSTGNELPYANDSHNFPISSGQPVASMLVNEQRNIDNQPTYWMQNNLSHREAFVNVGNQVSSSDITHLSNSVPATMTTATSLNEVTDVASINGNETDDSTLFIDDISRDVDICQMVSSFSSYDDDIDYENYVDDEIAYNENSVSTTMTFDHESNSALSTTIKTELRPLYDTSNYSQYNYDSTFNNQSSIFYELATKKELENSSDRIILKDSTIT